MRLVFKPNAAFNELRNQPGVVADLRKRAQAVAAAAGPSHEVEVETGRTRPRAAVFATPGAEPHALLRAIDAAR